MKLNLCLIVALYLALDVCVWHGPVERFARQQLSVPPAARVHGQAITAEDLDHAVQADCFRRGVNLAALDEPTREEIRKQVLGKMVDGALVRAARLADTSPLRSLAHVDEELQLFIKQFPDEADFPERLALQHLTETGLRERMQASLDDLTWINKQIQPQLATVTEAEARAWFAKHQAELTVPESFHAAHLFLSGYEKDKPDREPEIRALYQQLLTDATTLEKLAATASDDERTKVRGGDLGWFTRQRMPADFMAGVTSLSPGQMGKPVQTKLGWHVIKLIEKKPARIPAFEEVYDEVLEMLRHQQRETAVKALMARLRN